MKEEELEVEAGGIDAGPGFASRPGSGADDGAAATASSLQP